MSTYQYWGVYLALLYVLQTSFLPRLAFHDISPDLMLLAVISLGLLKGARIGVLIGFACGMLESLANGTFFGVDIFNRMLIGFVCGKISDQVFKDQFLLPVTASLFATVFNYFLWAALLTLMGHGFDYVEHAKYVLLPMLGFQLLFAYPVHRATYLLDQWLAFKK